MQTNLTGGPSPASPYECRYEDLKFLADATRSLLSLNVEEALREVARRAVPYLGELCVIDIYREDRVERLAEGAIEGAGPVRMPSRSLPANQVETHVEHTRTRMVVPVVGERSVLGALTLVTSLPRRYTDGEREVAKELARRVAAALHNAQRYRDACDDARGRDEFLSIAAHEIRGALTSMRLAVQGLLRGTLSEVATQTALEVIQREDRRLSRFVDDLLDVVRLRTGQLHFDLEDVDLGHLVRDVVTRLAAGDVAGRPAVTVMTEGGIVGRWDRGRLDQAITNLVTNAIKYGDGKPVEVSVSSAGRAAQVVVTDRGIGIDAEMLSSIFNPFKRGVDGRKYGGLGLGLHIVKTIVEQLGGTIAVRSRPGAGSTFTIELPVTGGAVPRREQR